jgi:peptidoglycan/LPS O-acetylase OafA/YrhL
MMLGTLQAAWIVCFTLGVAIPQFADMPSRWLRRTSHLIARYSYGIYLTHYFCLWLAFVQLHSIPRMSQCFVFAATVLLVPVFLYHFLELPLTNAGKQLVEQRLAPPCLQALAGRAG